MMPSSGSEERKSSADGPTWYLGDLYSNEEDPGIDRDLESARRKALRFNALYRDTLEQTCFDAEKLRQAIVRFESIHQLGAGPLLYAYLRRASDTGDSKAQRLYQKVLEKWQETVELLLFFRIKIATAPPSTLKRWSEDPVLQDYSHFLVYLSAWSSHTLSEAEECAIRRKDLSGKEVLVSLYEGHIASISFSIEIDGKSVQLNANEALELLRSESRAVRELAYRSFLRRLGTRVSVFKEILNALLLDHVLEAETRSLPEPIHFALLRNEVEASCVESMMRAVESRYPLIRKYWRTKARKLGLGKLENTDLLAPIQQDIPPVAFSDARDLILEASASLHPSIHRAAKEVFTHQRVHAASHHRKQAGAFCKCLSPSHGSYISMVYRGRLGDLLTLAHEVGHAVHYRLASGQSYLNFYPPPVLAEIASTFMEIALVQALLDNADWRHLHRAVTASHIDSIGTTVFRQLVITRFEQVLHQRRKERFLNEAEVCRLWREENSKLYHNAIALIPEYEWGWIHIPHLIRLPFYCISYIFGNLTALALFQRYHEEGASYSQQLINLFTAGGSRAPAEILESIGMIPGPALWNQAFQCLDKMIADFETG